MKNALTILCNFTKDSKKLLNLVYLMTVNFLMSQYLIKTIQVQKELKVRPQKAHDTRFLMTTGALKPLVN